MSASVGAKTPRSSASCRAQSLSPAAVRPTSAASSLCSPPSDTSPTAPHHARIKTKPRPPPLSAQAKRRMSGVDVGVLQREERRTSTGSLSPTVVVGQPPQARVQQQRQARVAGGEEASSALSTGVGAHGVAALLHSREPSHTLSAAMALASSADESTEGGRRSSATGTKKGVGGPWEDVQVSWMPSPVVAPLQVRQHSLPPPHGAQHWAATPR